MYYIIALLLSSSSTTTTTCLARILMLFKSQTTTITITTPQTQICQSSAMKLSKWGNCSNNRFRKKNWYSLLFNLHNMFKTCLKSILICSTQLQFKNRRFQSTEATYLLQLTNDMPEIMKQMPPLPVKLNDLPNKSWEIHEAWAYCRCFYDFTVIYLDKNNKLGNMHQV